jgi:hypothetical protein
LTYILEGKIKKGENKSDALSPPWFSTSNDYSMGTYNDRNNPYPYDEIYSEAITEIRDIKRANISVDIVGKNDQFQTIVGLFLTGGEQLNQLGKHVEYLLSLIKNKTMKEDTIKILSANLRIKGEK